MADLAGTYLTLFQSDSYEETGSFRLTVNSQGRGTAQLKLGEEPAQTFRISGTQFAIGGTASPSGEAFLSARSKSGELSGRIVRQIDGTTAFEGTVTDDDRSIPLSARAVLPTAAAPQAGSYTLVLGNTSEGTPLTSGVAGIGFLKVSKSGNLRFSSLLSNGQALTQGTQLLDNGTWLLSAQARGDRAFLSGAVTFSNLPASDLRGAVHWLRPLRTKGERVLQESASAHLLLVGSEYQAAKGVTPQVSQPAGWLLTIETSTDTAAFHVAFRSQGQLRTTRVAGGSASIQFATKAGNIIGTYKSGQGRRSKPLIGVLLQKTGEAFGLAGRSGSFSMTPSNEAVATGTGGLGNGGTGAGSVKVGSGTIVIGNPGPIPGEVVVTGNPPSTPSGTVSGGSVTTGGIEKSGAGTLVIVNPGTYPGDVVVTGNPPPTPVDTTSGGSPQIGSLPDDSSGAVLQPVDPYTGYTTGASVTTGAWMTFTPSPYLTGQTGTTTAIPAGTILIISGTTLPAGDRFTFGTAPDTSTYTSLQLLQWVEAAHTTGVLEMNMNGVRVILQ